MVHEVHREKSVLPHISCYVIGNTIGIIKETCAFFAFLSH